MLYIIKKIIIIFLPTLLLLAIVEVMLCRFQTSYDVKKKQAYGRANRIEAIILGSSHALQGINPEIFGKNVYNLANVSQDLHHDMMFVQNYIEDFPELKLVILPVDYFSLKFKLANSPESFRQYFYSQGMGIYPEDFFDKLNIKNYSRIMLYGPNKSIGYLVNGMPIPEIDENGFQCVQSKTMLDNGKNRVEYHHEKLMNSSLINENIINLDNIVSYLTRKKINVVFVVMPVHESYRIHIDENNMKQMINHISTVSEKYNVKIFNYFYSKDFDDSDYYDSDHLNCSGANKFSRILYDDITRSL